MINLAGKVQATMSTEVALDLLKATESVKSLTSVVNSSTSAWKATEAQMKSAGDYAGAAKAKYEGLGSAIEAQKAKIDALKNKQSEIKGTTNEAAQAFEKYQSQINKATTKLSSMESQQNRAKSAMELQQSGILQLNNSIKAQTSLMEATIKKQEALGDAEGATNTKIESLTSINDKYEQVLSKEIEQLDKVKNASGETSDAYTRQATRVENLKTKIAENNNEISKARENSNKTGGSFFTNLKEKLLGTNEEAEKSEGLMHKATSYFVGGVLVNGFQNATSAVKGFAEQGFESAEAAQEVAEKWKNMGASEADITTMGNSVKSLKENTNLSGTAVANLTTKFYDMTGSASKTNQLAQGVGSLSDKLKLTSTQADGFASGLSKIEASGKITSSSLGRIEKQAPGLGTALQQASGMSKTAFDSLVSSGKMTSTQFNDILQKASKDYRKNSDEFDSSSQGALKHIKQSWADTKQALMTPLVNVAATGLSSLSKVLEAPAMQNAIKQLGTGIADLGTKLTGVMNYISAHENSIQSIISSLLQITKLLVIGAWDAFKGTITGISNVFNDMTGNANKTKDPLKSVASLLKEIASHKKGIEDAGKVLVAVFAAKTVLSGIHSMMDGVRSLYKDFNTLKTGMVAIKTFAATNPFIFWITAITAVVVALVELYKHNTKFRDFVNGIVKSCQQLYEGMTKWFGQAWNTIKKGVSDTLNFIKKNWAGLALMLVNPIVGGLVLLYNNNPKFKKWANDLWSGIKNAFTSGWNAIKNACLAGVNWVVKKWNELKSGVINIANALWNTVKSIWNAWYNWTINIDNTIMHAIVNIWNAIKNSVINIVNVLWNGVKTVFTTLKNWSIDIFNGLKTGVVNIWNGLKSSISDVTNGIWNGIKTIFTTIYDWLNKTTGGRLGDVLNTFKSIFGTIQNVIEDAVKGVRHGFIDIVDAILKPFNDMLSGLEKGINWVLDKVGASKIKGTWKVDVPTYATGTQGGVLHDQLALVNDAKGANYREMYHTPDGQVGMFPAQRNMIVPLKAGTEILDGNSSAKLAGLIGLQKYASGSIGSFFSGIFNKGKDLLEDADKIIAHPIQFLESIFSRFAGGIKAGAGLASDIITNFPSTIAKSAVNWIKSLFSEDAGGSSANPSGSGVQRWKDDVIKALRANGLSTSSDMVAKVLRQIATESGGNPNAKQPGSDPDGDGSGPALGLMQTKRSTFNANKFAGHGSIFNGYDNLLAALKYAKARYGSSLSFLGNGHGYENGGIVDQHGFYEVAEHNNPEAIVPLASIKNAAATLVLEKVASRIASETDTKNLGSDSDKDYEKKFDTLAEKFDVLISLMKTQIKTANNSKAITLDSGAIIGELYPGIKAEQIKEITLSNSGTSIKVGR